MSSTFSRRAVGPRGAALAALVLLALPALPLPAVRVAAAAQEPRIDSPYRWIPEGLRAGPVAGFFNADRGNLEFGPGSTAVGGGRFRIRVSSPLSLELGATLGSSDRFVIDPRLEEGPAPVDTVSSTWLAAQAGIQLALTGARTWNGIQPYVLLGGGFMVGLDEQASEVFAEPDLADFRYEIGVAPSFMGGVGAELKPSRRIGIGLELRDHLLRLKAPEGFFRTEVLEAIEEAGAPAPEDSQWPHNLELGVGLWYYF